MHGSDDVDWPRVRADDEVAFARVFDRHVALVHNFLRRRLDDDQAAEDLTSEVFLQAWRQRRDIDLFDGSLRPWLLAVARNLVRRHWRTHSRRWRAIRRLPFPVADRITDDDLAAFVDGRAAARRLRRRVEALPRIHAEVVLLWAWEQLSYHEIAQVLDVPIGTVRSRLARARARLDVDEPGEPDPAGDGDERPKDACPHRNAPCETRTR